jgi:hypothetical protein
MEKTLTYKTNNFTLSRCINDFTSTYLDNFLDSFFSSFKPSLNFLNNLNQPSLFISDLIETDTSQWIPSVVNSVFDDISAREILRMRIMQNPKPQYIWAPSSSDKFSISLAYLTLVRSHWPVCSLNATSGF